MVILRKIRLTISFLVAYSPQEILSSTQAEPIWSDSSVKNYIDLVLELCQVGMDMILSTSLPVDMELLTMDLLQQIRSKV